MNMVRAGVAVALAIAAVVQVASESALGVRAVSHSVPAALAATLSDQPLRALVGGGATWLAPIGADAALLRADVPAANAFIARMPAGRRLDAFTGRLALARGDETLGIGALLQAGDPLALADVVDRLDQRGDYRRARDIQRALVDRLVDIPTNGELRAQAWWRLGALDAEVGYREPAIRKAAWERALGDDLSALELVPLSITYLLAAGNQSLLNGDRAGAVRYFRRAIDLDPAGPDAHAGLVKALTGAGLSAPFEPPRS